MEEDKWLPSSGLDVPTGLTTDIACYILQNICQAFKGILDREIQTMKLARELNEANNAGVSAVKIKLWQFSCRLIYHFSSESFWKRLQQSRETCDICDGTIFNLHFICESCGFTTCSVCLQKRLAGKHGAAAFLYHIQLQNYFSR